MPESHEITVKLPSDFPTGEVEIIVLSHRGRKDCPTNPVQAMRATTESSAGHRIRLVVRLPVMFVLLMLSSARVRAAGENIRPGRVAIAAGTRTRLQADTFARGIARWLRRVQDRNARRSGRVAVGPSPRASLLAPPR